MIWTAYSARVISMEGALRGDTYPGDVCSTVRCQGKWPGQYSLCILAALHLKHKRAYYYLGLVDLAHYYIPNTYTKHVRSIMH